MKKIYILLLVSFFFCAKAQYTITSSSKPVVGDVESTIDIDTAGLVVNKPGGTSQTWNYSGITVSPTVSVNSKTYTSMSSVPNASLFPGATIASGGSGYYAVYNNSSGIQWIGSAAPQQTDCIVASNGLNYYTFPITYGNTQTDAFALSFYGMNINGNFTVTGDGTGTLILPSGTYNNVLRLKYTVYETVSGAQTGTTNITEYRYFSAASKFPLLVVGTETDVVTAQPTSIYKYGTSNADIFAGVKELQIVNGFKSYPNPADHTLYIDQKNADKFTAGTLTNIIGQTVSTFILSSEPVQGIEVSSLEAGMYILNLTGPKGTSSKKILIE